MTLFLLGLLSGLSLSIFLVTLYLIRTHRRVAKFKATLLSIQNQHPAVTDAINQVYGNRP